MKKIILITLSIYFISSQITFSQQVSNKETILCKKWYVAEAFETKESGEKNDQSKQAQGAEFVFKSDHTVDFIMRYIDRERNGSWEFVNNDSLRIEFSKKPIVFYINHFSEDSLNLIGKEHSYSLMHIAFSSSYIAPYENEEIDYEDIEINEDAIEVQPIKNIDIDSDPVVNQNISKLGLTKEKINYLICNKWNLQKANITEGKEVDEFDNSDVIVFQFDKDKSFKYIEDGELEELGKWEILDDLTLNLDVDNEIVNFKIITIDENNLTISGEKDGAIMRMQFKSEKSNK